MTNIRDHAHCFGRSSVSRILLIEIIQRLEQSKGHIIRFYMLDQHAEMESILHCEQLDAILCSYCTMRSNSEFLCNMFNRMTRP